jgi:uncharacterized protein (DUF305 family)
MLMVLRRSLLFLIVLPAFTLAPVSACRSAGTAGPALVQPGAPGEPTRAIGADRATDQSRVQVTAADIRFMQGMIGHHAQAVEMVALLPTRTTNEDVKQLALRIELSQADEIAMMEQWLAAHGQPRPDPHAHHGHGAALMPGMLTPEEMTRLAAATGPAFDRLFLEGMIQHHQGAITMVQALFEEPGAGQDSDIYAFASDVDADQRMEIERMRRMLYGSGPGTPGGSPP